MLPTEPDSFLQILLPRLSNRRHLSWKPADYHESVNRWRHTFSRKLFAKSGEWIVGGFDWHVFAYGYAEAITGKAAVERYHRQTAVLAMSLLIQEFEIRPAALRESCRPTPR